MKRYLRRYYFAVAGSIINALTHIIWLYYKKVFGIDYKLKLHIPLAHCRVEVTFDDGFKCGFDVLRGEATSIAQKLLEEAIDNDQLYGAIVKITLCDYGLKLTFYGLEIEQMPSSLRVILELLPDDEDDDPDGGMDDDLMMMDPPSQFRH